MGQTLQDVESGVTLSAHRSGPHHRLESFLVDCVSELDSGLLSPGQTKQYAHCHWRFASSKVVDANKSKITLAKELSLAGRKADVVGFYTHDSCKTCAAN